MEEKFIIVCTVDGDTTRVAHSSQKEALHQAEKLLREHGCDLEITLHMDDMSSSPCIWFNRKRMRQWCAAGFPTVRI
jgi:hypothetical protein